jgi:C4-dicarboxylate-specific signal transduction histidine kinase
MGRANPGDDYGLEPGELPELPGNDSPLQARVRKLVDEVRGYDRTLELAADFSTEIVRDAMTLKAAALLRLSVLIPQSRAEEAGREVQRLSVERERQAREEESRRVEELRAAMAADEGLRREVERRNRWDTASGNFKSHGPLPGGFDDSLRRKL